MKRIVSTFLILAVFSLSLACFMPLCFNKAQAAPVQNMAMETPCHEMTEDKKNSLASSDMLMMDCLDEDFVHSIQASDLSPKHDISKINWDIITVNTDDITSLPDSHFARGPPPSLSVSDSSFPPVFLTTQRLRI